MRVSVTVSLFETCGELSGVVNSVCDDTAAVTVEPLFILNLCFIFCR